MNRKLLRGLVLDARGRGDRIPSKNAQGVLNIADAKPRGPAGQRAATLTCLTHSADVGLLISALGVRHELVEDRLGGGVAIGARANSVGVEFSMSLRRGVAATDEDPDGLIDDRRRS